MKALAIEPNIVEILYNKGLALDSLGKSEEAITYYDKVLAIDPNDVDALNNKGAALGKLGKSQEAIQYFDKVLQQESNTTEVSYNQNEDIANLTDVFSSSSINFHPSSNSFLLKVFLLYIANILPLPR